MSPLAATRTQVVAFAGNREPIANFGYFEGVDNYTATRTIRLWNKGSVPMTFAVGTSNAAGSPHSLTPSQGTVTVQPGGFSPVHVTLSVGIGTVGNASAFREVSGLVTFTPQGGANNNVTLRVPYYLVPRALSQVDVTVADSTPSFTTTATVANNSEAAIAGSADFYAWGLRDGNDGAGGAGLEPDAEGNPVADEARWDTIFLFTYTVSVFNPRVVSFDYQNLGSAANPGVTEDTVQWWNATLGNFAGSNAAAGVFMDDLSDNITVVPAPGALALLGLGGLVAGRRRRA